jgi:hypothetical protein
MNPIDTSRPQLEIRSVNLDTGRENVVVILRQSKALRAEIFRGFSRAPAPPTTRRDAYQSFPGIAARMLYRSTDSCSN